MKSAYELAMERMGGSDQSLSDEQKKAISEIDAKYKAKIAEKKIFLEKSISEAMQSGAEETVQKLRQQVAEEITSLENKAEREKRHSRTKIILFYLKEYLNCAFCSPVRKDVQHCQGEFHNPPSVLSIRIYLQFPCQSRYLLAHKEIR